MIFEMLPDSRFHCIIEISSSEAPGAKICNYTKKKPQPFLTFSSKSLFRAKVHGK